MLTAKFEIRNNETGEIRPLEFSAETFEDLVARAEAELAAIDFDFDFRSVAGSDLHAEMVPVEMLESVLEIADMFGIDAIAGNIRDRKRVLH